MRILYTILIMGLLVSCDDKTPPPYQTTPSPPTEEELRAQKFAELQEQIQSNNIELFRLENTAGEAVETLKRMEGYVELYVYESLCGDGQPHTFQEVSLKVSREDCFEASDASELFELGQLYKLFTGAQDTSGHATPLGLKVPGIGEFNSVFITDSLGDLTGPFPLNKYFEVDTSYVYDTTFTYSRPNEDDENELFNLAQNEEIIESIDTITYTDTVATYYQDLTIQFGELSNIENALKQCKIKGDKLCIEKNTKIKEELKDEIDRLHSLRSRRPADIAKLKSFIDKLKQEALLHSTPETQDLYTIKG